MIIIQLEWAIVFGVVFGQTWWLSNVWCAQYNVDVDWLEVGRFSSMTKLIYKIKLVSNIENLEKTELNVIYWF